jgi:hypothetical protein
VKREELAVATDWEGNARRAKAKAKSDKPQPAVGQRWRLDRFEGVIVKVLPGGGGGLGIVEFEGEVPSAHVSTMLRFPGWSFIPAAALPPPCTCVTLEGGVILSDGCAMHDARNAARSPSAEMAKMGEAMTDGIAEGTRKP